MLDHFFGNATFIPHGYCLLWRPDLVAMHVGGDVLIFIAYTVIAFSIWRFMRVRKEFRFNGVALLFAAFVFGCGVTHLFSAIALWWPAYEIQAIAKVTVAVISVAAAIAIWRALPMIIGFPTVTEIKQGKERLQYEISERAAAERAIAERDKMHITLRANEAQLLAALQRAKRAEQTRSTFLAAMSHDLRTPLNAIMGFSDALRLRIAEKIGRAKEVEYFDHIHSSAAHLLDLINDLLDLSSIEGGAFRITPEDIDMAELVDEVVTESRSAARSADVVFRVTAQTDAAKAYCDRVAMHRMISNILGNAVKYSPEGGVIDVVIASDFENISITIIDDGEGFPLGRLDSLRTPFTQADSKKDGVGLGLTIVDVLAKAQHGAMHMENSERRGAKVTLTIPRAQLAKARQGAASLDTLNSLFPTASIGVA